MVKISEIPDTKHQLITVSPELRQSSGTHIQISELSPSLAWNFLRRFNTASGVSQIRGRYSMPSRICLILRTARLVRVVLQHHEVTLIWKVCITMLSSRLLVNRPARHQKSDDVDVILSEYKTSSAPFREICHRSQIADLARDVSPHAHFERTHCLFEVPLNPFPQMFDSWRIVKSDRCCQEVSLTICSVNPGGKAVQCSVSHGCP